MSKSKFALKKKKYDISAEVAMDQVMDFLETYDIDIEAIDDKKSKSGVESTLNKMVNYTRLKLIEFVKNDEKITISQHLSHPKGEVTTLVYSEIKGKNKVSMDGKSENDRYEMMYSLAGSLSGIGYDGILKLEGKDLSVAEVLGAIFLQI